MYLCIRTEVHKKSKSKSNEECQLSKTFFEILSFLSLSERLNSHNVFEIITKILHALPFFFVFPTGKCKDTGNILMWFGHLSHPTLFSSQKKLENRKILNEI